LDFVTGFQSVERALEMMDPTSASATVDRIRQTIAFHHSQEGVWIESRSWIVTSRRL
jgi:hypothetical protein